MEVLIICITGSSLRLTLLRLSLFDEFISHLSANNKLRI